MKRVQRTCASLGLAMMVGMAASARGEAPATEPSDSDLRGEVREMRAEMDRMRDHEQVMEKQLAATTQASASTAELRADQDRAIEQVYQDAIKRSQLLTQFPMGAGYDPSHGFYIASDDGNFRLRPFMLLQVRDVTTYRNHGDGASDDTQNGFEIRRLQLGIEGNLFNPDLSYRAFIQNDRTTGDMRLYDAWAKYHFASTPWSIEGGQFKAPLDHEAYVADRTLMAVERTLSDDILANGEAFSDGVMAIYDPNTTFRARADFTNGYDVDDLDYEEPPQRADNFGMGGRGEYKFFGDWKDYDQFTSLHDKEDLLVAGGGLDWSEDLSANSLRHVVDVQYNHGGLGLYGAYLGRYTGHGHAADTYDASVRGQVSYLMSNMPLEPFVRYDFLRLDPAEFTGSPNVDVHEITGGANYYFYGQNCKLTMDLTYLPNGSPIDDNASGVLVNAGHAELILRAQFQLAL